MSASVAFAALKAAGTFRRMAGEYRKEAVESPRWADRDTEHAERCLRDARFFVRLARVSLPPRLPQ